MIDATIILCGGSIDRREIPLAMQPSNAMIPVNGRPVISWILNDLIRKNIRDVVVVLRVDDFALRHFLERCYAERLDLSIACVDSTGSIVLSLYSGLATIPHAGLVRVVLGDTLITDSYESDEDFVYTGAVDYAARWCLVTTDKQGFAAGYLDKQAAADPGLHALAGYYHFVDAALLRFCTERVLESGKGELSSVLDSYGKVRRIRSVAAKDWYDFGHIDKLAEARHRLFSMRSFNSLHYDSVLQTVTKTSSHNAKLADELNWYVSLPPGLQVLSPRLLSHKIDEGRVSFTQEFYGYNSLAELFVFGDLSEDVWTSILRKVLDVHHLMIGFKGPVSQQDLWTMYFEKTRRRVEQLRHSDASWDALLRVRSIEFNGRTLLNLDRMMPQIEARCHDLLKSADGTVIHGDLCFSNILFDLPNQIVRLIDPRGRFGTSGIYGDPRYDMAKLRHSACGLYDFITLDMFTIVQSDNRFEAKVHALKPLDLTDRFDAMIGKLGYDPEDIRFIEGLLFASMLPLHADRPDFQLMMYCRSLELLNRALGLRNLTQ